MSYFFALTQTYFLSARVLYIKIESQRQVVEEISEKQKNLTYRIVESTSLEKTLTCPFSCP